MPLILAQLKKDTRALRGLLIAFAACVVGHACSGLTTSLWLAIAGFAQFWLGLVLVVEVIHADPLTESTAFWRTRPMPRGSLFLAKLLFIAALVLAGWLGAWAEALLAGNAFHPSAAFWILAALLAAMAAITSSLPQLLGRLLAVGVASWIFAFAAVALLTATLGGVFLVHHVGGTARQTTIAWENPHVIEIIGWLFPLACLGVAAHQYLTLRTRTSLILLGAVCLLAALGVMGIHGQLNFGSPVP